MKHIYNATMKIEGSSEIMVVIYYNLEGDNNKFFKFHLSNFSFFQINTFLF